jgi:TPR repeat protein
MMGNTGWGQRGWRIGVLGLLAQALLGLAWAQPVAHTPSRDDSDNDLSYGHFVDSTSRFKCLYGYVADKTGDHDAARAIFEDCAQRFGDVYSMIWLAQMEESGAGRPPDDARATAWVRQGALMQDAAGYSSLARYHYGVALHQGRGVAQDVGAARHWLSLAAAEGVRDAADYLSQHGLQADR